MKRFLLIICSLLAANSFAAAQVVADFETNLNGFSNPNFGPAMTGVSRVADPTGKSAGVMKLLWNFPGMGFTNGAVSAKNAIPVNGARFITYWVYFPVSTPANLNVGVFAQDNKNYRFHQNTVLGSTIPKSTWYPISLDLQQTLINDPQFDIVTGNIYQTGIQLDNGLDTVSVWKDSIYVDNVALVGSQPVKVADFETGLNGYTDVGFGPALKKVAQVTDPTASSAGVMQLNLSFPADTNSKGAVGVKQTGGLAVGNAEFITYWVFLPDSSMPDSFAVSVFAQDNKNYTYHDVNVLAKDIPKKKWYPLSLDLQQELIKDPQFDILTGNLFQTGIQIQSYNYHGAIPGWKDSIYIDNVALLSVQAASPVKKYVLANFNTPGDVAGFFKETWAPAVTAVANGIDTTNAANRVLLADFSFSDTGSTPVTKGAFGKNNVGIFSATADTTATDIAIDVFIPVGMPDSAQFAVAFQGTATGGNWTADNYALGTSSGTLQKGQWNTLKYNVAGHIKDGSITKTRGTGTFILQVLYANPPKWNGRLFFDNLTLFGIADAPTSVAQNTSGVPHEYQLYNNYPNPFNPSTTIRYSLKQDGVVTLKVYDVLGREVTTLVNEPQKAGSYSVLFDAKQLASGTYFYTIRAGSFVKTEKMMLLK
jgi:hypothetical protein